MKEIHILLLGILFSLVFVVPQADHLYGIDTIRNYELSNDIAKRGHIYWSMTPFSVIGSFHYNNFFNFIKNFG